MTLRAWLLGVARRTCGAVLPFFVVGLKSAAPWVLLASLSACASAPRTPAATNEAERWLARAAQSPRNGDNPQLDVSAAMVEQEAQVFREVILHGSERERQDAAFALAHHPDPPSLREFWRQQLSHPDPVVRRRAGGELADVHDSGDLSAMLQCYLSFPDMHPTQAARLRDWRARRSVPALVEMLSSSEVLVRENAGTSLSREMIPGVPFLEPKSQADFVAEHHEAADGRRYWTAAPRSYVPPYLRWWAAEGRAAFAEECEWWNTFAGALRPACAAPDEDLGESF